MGKDNFQMDLCSGSLLPKMFSFALPLALTFLLHLCFNAADLIVVGHFAADHRSMAGIGSTISLNGLMLNLFIGLSIGTNVLVSRHFGAKDAAGVRKAVHTAILMAICGGLLLMITSISLAKPLLLMMKTPADVMPFALNYVIICFLATPFILIYNTGCAILRAVGDTKRPLFFLIIAGVFNVVMNLVFVIVFKMDAVGVALATLLSHGISMLLVLRVLCRTEGMFRVERKHLRIDRGMMKEMLAIGIPAGVQSSSFSFSNIIIQSSINTFGSVVIAGNTAAFGVEGFVSVIPTACHHTAITFVSQNLGGLKFKRMLRCILYCLILPAAIAETAGLLVCTFDTFFLSIFNPDPAVIKWGAERLRIVMILYGTCALLDAATGILRGMGYSFISAVVCLSGACFLQILWVFFVFPLFNTYASILISYPIVWGLAGVIGWITLSFLFKKVVRKTSHHLVLIHYTPGVLRGLRYIMHPH